VAEKQKAAESIRRGGHVFHAFPESGDASTARHFESTDVGGYTRAVPSTPLRDRHLA
jgi:hypothetical protein